MDNRFPVKTEENIDYQVMPRQFALNTNHDKEKPFQCVSCNAGFLDKNALNGHFEAVKKNPLQWGDIQHMYKMNEPDWPRMEVAWETNG